MIGSILPRTRFARLVLGSMLAAGLACRLFVAFTDDGIYWPDEIYQSIEPAHHLVFGYGLLPWEYGAGARSWVLPGFVALVLKICTLTGAGEPWAYLHVIRLVFVAVSMAACLGIYRLARAIDASEAASAVGAGAWALAAPAIYFADRALSENVAAALAVWAMALIVDRQASRRAVVAGASLLGLAVLFRLHMGLLAVAVVGMLAAARETRRAIVVTAVLAVWALILGALDAVTWGHLADARYGGWFHSGLTYLRFTFSGPGASQWGTEPGGYYLIQIVRSMPAVAAVLAAGLAIAWRRSWRVTIVVLVFVAVHSAIGHKEYRFILPILPLAIGAAMAGLDLLRRPWRLAAIGALAAASIVSAAGFRDSTWGAIGGHPERASASAWDDSGPINRLLLDAHERANLCGIRLDMAPAWQGGASYLHRRVPMYFDPAGNPDRYNFIIGPAGPVPPKQKVVARDDGWQLIWQPLVTNCSRARDGVFRWRLP